MPKDSYPMLAKPVDWKKVVYPCAIQPKLDGVRCLAFYEDDGVRLQSRDGKPILMEKLRVSLEGLPFPVGTILDGELYRHRSDFNKLSGDVRREVQDERKDDIEYWVYDLMRDPGGVHLQPYWVRSKHLETPIRSAHESIQLLSYLTAANEERARFLAQGFEQAGYEGAMIRTSGYVKPTKKNPDPEPIADFYQAAFYGHSRRSDFLQKVKTFEDDEATIIAIEEEYDLEGMAKGRTGKFVLRDNAGVEFRASGLLDEIKHDSWANPDKYIGTQVTYKFFGRSADGVPRHPSFKAFRPKGELDGPIGDEA